MRRTKVVVAVITTVALLLGFAVPASAGEVRNSRGTTAVFTQIYNNDSYKVNNRRTPYKKFDVLYIGFVHVNPKTNKLGFEISSTAGTVAEQKARLRNIQKLTAPLRRKGKIKLVVSMGFGYKFNDIPRIERHLKIFAPSVKRFLKANKLDGFDIDYEEPTFSSVHQANRVSKAIRKQLGKKYLFTITPNNTTNLRGSTLSKYYDYVNVQSYVTDHDKPMPVRKFVKLPGMDRKKLIAGADTEGGDKISRAIGDYRRYKLGGVFDWQLQTNFNRIANQMWQATR